MERPDDNIIEFITAEGECYRWSIHSFVNEYYNQRKKRKGPFIASDLNGFLNSLDAVLHPEKMLETILGGHGKDNPELHEIRIGNITDEKVRDKFQTIGIGRRVDEIEIGEGKKGFKYLYIGHDLIEHIELDHTVYNKIKGLNIENTSIKFFNATRLLDRSGSSIRLPLCIHNISCFIATEISNFDDLMKHGRSDLNINIIHPSELFEFDEAFVDHFS